MGALTAAEARIGALTEAVANLENRGKSRSDEEAALISEKAKLEQKVIKLEAELAKQRKQAIDFQESILSLQDEVEKLNERVADLRKREMDIAFKLREARRTQVVENNMSRMMDDMKRLQIALDDEKEALAGKNILVTTQVSSLRRYS